MATDNEDRLVLIEGALWWNFERFCRLHGYVLKVGSVAVSGEATGTEITYVHRPGAPPPEWVTL